MQTLSSSPEGLPFKTTQSWQSGTVRWVEVHIFDMIQSFIINGTGSDILRSSKELQNTGCPFLHIKDWQDNFYEVVGSETGLDILEVVDKDGNKFEVSPYQEETESGQYITDDGSHGIVWQEEYFNRYLFQPIR